MRRSIPVLLIALYSLNACVGSKPPAFQPTEQSPFQIYHTLDRAYRQVSSFHGEATITIDTPEQSGQVKGQIDVHSPQKAEILLQTPFGGVVGRLEIRRHYLMFYDADDHLQYIGSPDDTGIPALPELFTGQQELIPILTGMINLPDNFQSTLTSDSLNNGMYVLHFSSDSTHSAYEYNPAVGMFAKYSETNNITGQQTKILFDKFTRVNDFHFPRTIKVVQPEQKRLLSIYYHSITINREDQANAL